MALNFGWRALRFIKVKLLIRGTPSFYHKRPATNRHLSHPKNGADNLCCPLQNNRFDVPQISKSALPCHFSLTYLHISRVTFVADVGKRHHLYGRPSGSDLPASLS